jgi:glycosyltransferase involved in cell wall biosynthesis
MTRERLRVIAVDQAVGVWGAQQYLLRLAPLMRERGVELTLAVPPSLEMYDAWRSIGFAVLGVDLPVHRSIRSAGRPSVPGLWRESRSSLRASRLIAGLVRNGDFDAIWSNAHWLHLEAGLTGIICRKPVVLHLHEELPPGLGNRLRAASVRLATRSVAVSRAVVAGLPASVLDRVAVIPNGVDVQAMSPPRDSDRCELQHLRQALGIGNSDVMVLAATRLDPDKRVEDLIDAVRRIDDSRVHLVVAGATSRFPDYECEVRAMGNALPAGRVTFCGHSDDMAALFRASDVVIHAGVVEGMPLGLLEAQSCGKPAVAYRVAGVPEAVLDGKTGLLAEPLDVAGLSDALRRLVTDPALRRRLGLAGRAHVVQHHQLATQADRNVALLAEICGIKA